MQLAGGTDKVYLITTPYALLYLCNPEFMCMHQQQQQQLDSSKRVGTCWKEKEEEKKKKKKKKKEKEKEKEKEHPWFHGLESLFQCLLDIYLCT